MTEPYAIQEEDLPTDLWRSMTSWLHEMVEREKEGRGFNFFHFMIDLTRRPLCVQSACPAVVRVQNIWL